MGRYWLGVVSHQHVRRGLVELAEADFRLTHDVMALATATSESR